MLPSAFEFLELLLIGVISLLFATDFGFDLVASIDDQLEDVNGVNPLIADRVTWKELEQVNVLQESATTSGEL